MINKIQDGNILELTAPYTRLSGEGALVGSLFGVAFTDVASGAIANFAIKGVFELAKAAVAVTQGEAAYWDNTAKVVTNVPTSNTLIGAFTVAAAIGDAKAKVRLK